MKKLLVSLALVAAGAGIGGGVAQAAGPPDPGSVYGSAAQSYGADRSALSNFDFTDVERQPNPYVPDRVFTPIDPTLIKRAPNPLEPVACIPVPSRFASKAEFLWYLAQTGGVPPGGVC